LKLSEQLAHGTQRHVEGPSMLGDELARPVSLQQQALLNLLYRKAERILNLDQRSLLGNAQPGIGHESQRDVPPFTAAYDGRQPNLMAHRIVHGLHLSQQGARVGYGDLMRRPLCRPLRRLPDLSLPAQRQEEPDQRHEDARQA